MTSPAGVVGVGAPVAGPSTTEIVSEPPTAPPASVAVMVALPTPVAVARPELSTVAVAVLELVQSK